MAKLAEEILKTQELGERLEATAAREENLEEERTETETEMKEALEEEKKKSAELGSELSSLTAELD